MSGQVDLFGNAATGRSAVAAVDPGDELRALAAQIPRGLRFGTSTWSFSGWQGIVYGGGYDETKLARDGLAAYAVHPLLRSVGVDRSFYAPLNDKTLQRMAAATSPDFRFLIKAHAALMLPKSARRPAYLEGVPDVFLDADYARRAVIEPALRRLGERLGVILFQFSPLGDRVLRYRQELLLRLEGFLAALPREAKYAVEWRDRAMLGNDLADLLARHGVAHGFAAHPRLPPVDEQSPLEADADCPLVIRWLLAPGLGYEEARAAYAPFDRIVDPDPKTRRQIAQLARKALTQGRQTIVIINNKAEGSAPLSVAALAKEFVQTVNAADPPALQ